MVFHEEIFPFKEEQKAEQMGILPMPQSLNIHPDEDDEDVIQQWPILSETDVPSNPEVQRSTRERKPPLYLQAYETKLPQTTVHCTSPYPITNYIGTNHFILNINPL